MHFLEIAGEKYGGDELSSLTANGLAGLGLDSFHSIDVDTRTNSIAIIFDKEEDSSTVGAITGSNKTINGKLFHSNNVSQFILELYSILTTKDNPD